MLSKRALIFRWAPNIAVCTLVVCAHIQLIIAYLFLDNTGLFDTCTAGALYWHYCSSNRGTNTQNMLSRSTLQLFSWKPFCCSWIFRLPIVQECASNDFIITVCCWISVSANFYGVHIFYESQNLICETEAAWRIWLEKYNCFLDKLYFQQFSSHGT